MLTGKKLVSYRCHSLVNNFLGHGGPAKMKNVADIGKLNPKIAKANVLM